MSASSRQATATIIPFPVKASLSPAADRFDARRPEFQTHPVVMSDIGSGWYHEAAMQESKRDRKH